jgi:dethiobiotin synthetase
MPNGLFITATDTGAGKTVVTAALVLMLRKNGVFAAAVKPVETGCTPCDKYPGKPDGLIPPQMLIPPQGPIHDNLIPRDGNFLKSTLTLPDPIDDITPVRYASPLAPLAAASIEGRPFDYQAVKAAIGRMSEKYKFLLVEGIGGLMVPLSDNFFVRDMIIDLAMPAIIVCRASLGTINHTLLTVEAALSRGINIAGIIINHTNKNSFDSGLAEATNPDLLRRLSPVPVIGVVPFISPVNALTLDEATNGLDYDIIKRLL